MGRIIAIDYGEKRCGLAETDDKKIIASPLATIPPTELISFLEKYNSKYHIDGIIVGEPKNLDGSESHSAKMINEFCEQLKMKFPEIKIEKQDERFTSKMALNSLVNSGAKKKTRANKSVIDQVSAVLILQSYLGKMR